MLQPLQLHSWEDPDVTLIYTGYRNNLKHEAFRLAHRTLSFSY